MRIFSNRLLLVGQLFECINKSRLNMKLRKTYLMWGMTIIGSKLLAKLVFSDWFTGRTQSNKITHRGFQTFPANKSTTCCFQGHDNERVADLAVDKMNVICPCRHWGDWTFWGKGIVWWIFGFIPFAHSLRVIAELRLNKINQEPRMASKLINCNDKHKLGKTNRPEINFLLALGRIEVHVLISIIISGQICSD